MTMTDLCAVPGVPECDLDEATVASLPPHAPPAPWDVALTSIIWYSRGGRAAGRAAGVVGAGRRGLVTIGGLVSYSRTPVGPYHEAFATVAVRAGRGVRGTVPFMAVDSLSSLVGGRSNWSLPKCLAEFSGEPAPTGSTMTAAGNGWSVRATAKPFGPTYRVPMAGRLVQAWPDGQLRESALTGQGRSRSAIVTVEVTSDGDLASWLRPGRHFGAVMVEAGFELSVPT